MGHPNEELVRSAFDAFAKGDVDTLRESMNQDAVWYVPGRNQLSGDHRGVDAILGFFASVAAPSAWKSTTSWPTITMRSRCLTLAPSARIEPMRTGMCS